MQQLDERRLSPAERAVAADLDFVAILVEAYQERVPRFFGDNEGVWPVRVRVSTDPRGIVSATDRASPVHEVESYTHFWIKGRPRAERVKAELDALLPDSLRRGWKTIDDPCFLAFLMADASDAAGVELYDDEQRLAAIRSEARRRQRVVASGGDSRQPKKEGPTVR